MQRSEEGTHCVEQLKKLRYRIQGDRLRGDAGVWVTGTHHNVKRQEQNAMWRLRGC